MPAMCPSSTTCESFYNGRRQSRLAERMRSGCGAAAGVCKERDRRRDPKERSLGAVLARAPGECSALVAEIKRRELRHYCLRKVTPREGSSSSRQLEQDILQFADVSSLR